jgi:hypothetical protein
MRTAKVIFLTAFVFAFLSLESSPSTTAQAQISITLGAAPNCPYGYYDYAPYNCSPYGYYGPEWFNGGVFIGTGRWYHGPANFHGQVNNSFDPRHGYHGAMPARGQHAAPQQQHGQAFHGNETHDNQGHVVNHGGGDHGGGDHGGH